MDVCCKSDILYERVLTHVCQCDLGFFFYLCAHVRVFSTRV